MSHGLVLERALWNSMMNAIEKRLPAGITPTKSEELDLGGGPVQLASDQTIGPVSVDRKHMPQEGHLPLLGRSAPIDDLAAYGLSEVQVKPFKQGPTCRQGVFAGRMATPKGPDESTRDAAQIPEAGMVEPIPDHLLPSTVEVLDLGLEAGLSGRGEDRGDSQKQAEPHDSTQDIGVLMGSLESGIVVELGIGRQPVLPPVAQQAGKCGPGGRLRGLGPCLSEASMQGDGRQDVDQRPVFNPQVFDPIEAVDFGLGRSDVRQVPALGGCGATQTTLSVQGSPTFQDTGDGSIRRNIGQTAADPFLAEGSGAVLAERAMNLQVLSQVQNEVLDDGGCAAGMMRAAGSVGEIHPVQSLACGMPDPALDGGLADVKLPGYDSHGQTSPDRVDEVPSLLCSERFLFIGSSPRSVFAPMAYPMSPAGVPQVVAFHCPAGIDTWPLMYQQRRGKAH